MLFDNLTVMAGLVPATHVLGTATLQKTWVPGTRPGMTLEERDNGEGVIPDEAQRRSGIHSHDLEQAWLRRRIWIPACAGMTAVWLPLQFLHDPGSPAAPGTTCAI